MATKWQSRDLNPRSSLQSIYLSNQSLVSHLSKKKKAIVNGLNKTYTLQSLLIKRNPCCGILEGS